MAVPLAYPLAQVSLAALRAVGKAFTVPAIRRWVLPVLVYEGSAYVVEFLLFTLKVRAANFFIPRRDDDQEIAAFLAWAEISPSLLEEMTDQEKRDLVSRYAEMREKARPGSRLGAALSEDPQ